MEPPIRIGVLGFGNVGRSLLQLLLSDNESRYDIEVYDIREDAKGAFLDLSHSSMVTKRHKMEWVSKLSTDLDVLFHSAGPVVKKGDSRLSVGEKALEINKEIFSRYQPSPETKIIVISNPVDLVARSVQELARVNDGNVIGTGTYIDKIRLEFYIAYYFKEHPSSVEALVLGEHGDSQVHVLSQTLIDNRRFVDHKNKKKVENAIKRTVNAAQEIKETQYATFYGVAACAFRILKMLHAEEKCHIPLSVQINDHYKEYLGIGEDIFLSLPTCLCNQQISIENDIQLRDEEIAALQNSARVLHKEWEKLI